MHTTRDSENLQSSAKTWLPSTMALVDWLHKSRRLGVVAVVVDGAGTCAGHLVFIGWIINHRLVESTFYPLHILTIMSRASSCLGNESVL